MINATCDGCGKDEIFQAGGSGQFCRSCATPGEEGALDRRRSERFVATFLEELGLGPEVTADLGIRADLEKLVRIELARERAEERTRVLVATGNYSEGAFRIKEERLRQISEERYDEKHDDRHAAGELARAAACYAVEGQDLGEDEGVVKVMIVRSTPRGLGYTEAWPWTDDDESDKRAKHSRLRRMVIAGALIAAEIDRLCRAGEK